MMSLVVAAKKVSIAEKGPITLVPLFHQKWKDI
jgi:hypothetical protein